MFPNNGNVDSIVDRLVHHSDIVVIGSESYRVHEATEEADSKKEAHSKGTNKNDTKNEDNPERALRGCSVLLGAQRGGNHSRLSGSSTRPCLGALRGRDMDMRIHEVQPIPDNIESTGNRLQRD